MLHWPPVCADLEAAVKRGVLHMYSNTGQSCNAPSRIRAGNVKINGASGGYDVPCGGFKQSGNGREWDAHGFNDFLEIKAVEGYGG